MANTTGYRDTNTVESTTLRRDIRETILEYDKNVTPLLVISSKIGGGSRETVNPKVEWYEEDRETRRDTSTTAASGPTTLAVTDGTRWHKDEVWRNTRTGEGFRVVSISVNNVTVVPNVSGAGSVATLSGDEYLKVGVAKIEGDTELDSFAGNPTAKFNYTQIFERTYAETRTMQNTAQYVAPHDWYFRAAKSMREFKIDKEAAYLWGPGPGIDTTGSHPRRYMGGIHPTISTNVKDFSGTMTESEFFDGFDTAFRYGNQEKIALAGRTPVAVIGGFPRGKLEVVQGDNDTTYGLKIMKYRHPLGVLNIFVHNLFNDSSSTYYSQMLILDVAGDGGDTLIQERYLQNSDVQITENVQEPGRDGRKDKILCESTVTTGLEKSHALWKNINS